MSRKGENIFKRKDGRWEARYIHRYEDGKAVYRYVYGKTYAEAKAKGQAELSAVEINNTALKADCTFDFVANLWLADIKAQIKESTYTRYHRTVHSYLIPYFSTAPTAEITARQICGFSDYLLNSKGLSPKTVTDILGILKAVFKFCKLHNYPCPDTDAVRLPKRSPKSVKILSAENRMKIEKELINSEEPASLGFLFALFTGVRIGELCGIRWGDIDFINATVTISRTVERIADLNPLTPNKTKVIISEPKTESSARVIPLPPFLSEHLKRLKKSDGFYLITGTNKFTEPHQYYVKYKKFLKSNGIDDYTFHALRHTFATRCVELNFDTKSLSEILGHSSINTTLTFYIHPTLQQKKVQMSKLSPSVY